MPIGTSNLNLPQKWPNISINTIAPFILIQTLKKSGDIGPTIEVAPQFTPILVYIFPERG